MENMEKSLEYQDFIAIELLKKLGWCINLMTSKRYQIEVGESICGVEIKNDRNMAKTGNLYIETAERHFTPNFVPSGINRKDNTVFWVIGDYQTAYIFSKDQLKFMCNNYQKFGFKTTETDTSKGVLIPISYLEKVPFYVIRKLYF